jgi:hypothetical protein
MTDDLLSDLSAIFSSVGGLGFFAAWFYMMATWLGGSGVLFGWLEALVPVATPF